MSTQPHNNYVHIFDTTLRDGEQSPGATMTSFEKIEVAKALARMGVDIIEAGFPAASPDDFEAVRRIAETVGNDSQPGVNPPVICGLARTTKGDISRAWDAIRSLDFESLVGHLSYNRAGDLQKQRVYVFRVQDGDFVQVFSE